MVPLVIVGVALILGRFDPAPRPQTRRASVAGGSLSGVYQPSALNSQLVHESAVALGAWAQAVTRIFADPFVERYSPTAVARVLLGVLGAGVLLVFSPRVAGWHCSALR